MTPNAHKYAWSLCACLWSGLWCMYHLAGPLADDYVRPSAPQHVAKPCTFCYGQGVVLTGCAPFHEKTCPRCGGKRVAP